MSNLKLKEFIFKRSFFIIPCIFFFIIILKAYYSPNSYLGPDAGWFLIAANNILEFKFLFFDELEIYGVEISNYKNFGSFFSAWPPLYPILISIVSFLLNIDVFIASKILNFFCFLIIFFILTKYIKSYFIIFFIFCNATFLEVYSYTLSEYLFITLILILIHNLNIYFSSKKNLRLFYIFIVLNLLFLTKLIGLSAHLAIIFLSGYFFLIEKKIYFKLIFVCIIAIFISFLYLLLLKHLTGYLTGYPRGLRDNYDYQLFYLIKAISIEINYFISSTQNNFNIDKNNWNQKYFIYIVTFILQLLPLFFLNIKKIKFNFYLKNFFAKKINLIIIFFAIFYFFPIFILLFLTNVDPIYFRTMSPFSFLLFFLFFKNVKIISKFFFNYLIYLISVSLSINLIIPFYIFS